MMVSQRKMSTSPSAEAARPIRFGDGQSLTAASSWPVTMVDMSRLLVLISTALALTAFVNPCCAQEGAFDWTIFRPGAWPSQYVDVAVPVAYRTGWLALVAGAHRWTLEPADANWFDNAKPSRPGTLAFLRNDALKAGPAPSPEMRFSGILRRFKPGSASLSLAFGGDSYEIAVHDRGVWMRQGSRRTKIGDAYVDANMGELFSVDLVWAGDLDRDGRLDLITHENNGGYSADLCLYLSSQAHSPDELLAKVGCEDWSG